MFSAFEGFAQQLFQCFLHTECEDVMIRNMPCLSSHGNVNCLLLCHLNAGLARAFGPAPSAQSILCIPALI